MNLGKLFKKFGRRKMPCSPSKARILEKVQGFSVMTGYFH